jgi:hypothetical protein
MILSRLFAAKAGRELALLKVARSIEPGMPLSEAKRMLSDSGFSCGDDPSRKNVLTAMATAFDDNHGVLVRIYFNADTVTRCEVKAWRADSEAEAELEAMRVAREPNSLYEPAGATRALALPLVRAHAVSVPDAESVQKKPAPRGSAVLCWSVTARSVVACRYNETV